MNAEVPMDGKPLFQFAAVDQVPAETSQKVFALGRQPRPESRRLPEKRSPRIVRKCSQFALSVEMRSLRKLRVEKAERIVLDTTQPSWRVDLPLSHRCGAEGVEEGKPTINSFNCRQSVYGCPSKRSIIWEKDFPQRPPRPLLVPFEAWPLPSPS